jgi:6,7-dimethyl-8-ribityllumazine synthase
VVKEYSGTFKPNFPDSVSHRRVAIIVSRYNLEITEKLRQGALHALKDQQVPEQNISIVWVPGAWELVAAAQKVLQQKNFDGIVCLGCVIRGETTHDQHINNTVSHSLGRLSIDFGIPVAFGLLTCNTWDQAVQRAGGKVGNKGVEATEALLEMFRLFDSMKAN